MSQLFAWGGQSIGASASASVFSVNIQGWFPLGWTGWISLKSEGFSRVFPNTTVWKDQFRGAQISLWSKSHIDSWLLSWWLTHLILKAIIRHSIRNSYPSAMERRRVEREKAGEKWTVSASNSSFLQKESRHELCGKKWHREEMYTATLKKKMFQNKDDEHDLIPWGICAWLRIYTFSEKVLKCNQFSEVWCKHSLPHIYLFSL